MIDAHLRMNLVDATQTTYGWITDSIEHPAYPGVDKCHGTPEMGGLGNVMSFYI